MIFADESENRMGFEDMGNESKETNVCDFKLRGGNKKFGVGIICAGHRCNKVVGDLELLDEI